VAVLAALAPLAAAADSPNILIVILDDVGVDYFASYGEAGACSASGSQCFADADCSSGQTCVEDYHHTTNIDTIAAEGVPFRNAWAAQQCKPSRAAAMSGRYGRRTGVTSNAGSFLASERTIAEALQDLSIVPAGYATGAFGKWGLGNNPSPNSRGFDRFAGHLGSAIGGDYFSWNRTVDGTTNTCSSGSSWCPGSSYATTVNVDDLLDWLSGVSGPWFAWLSFNAPHSPFHVPPHELVSPGTLARLPESSPGTPAAPGTDCTGGDRPVCFMAAIEAVDKELTRVLAALPPDTWVIVLGDNGTPTQVVRDPFVTGKGSAYEGGINIPLLVRAPDLRSAGEESAALVHVVDLFMTADDLAGGLMPLDRRLDALSLVPLVDDPAAVSRPMAYAETGTDQVSRDARYKLIRGGAGDELYDLEGDPPGVPGDPFEQNDLIAGGSLSPGEQAARDALDDAIDGIDLPSGRVPDGYVVTGTLLTVNHGAGGDLVLTWGASCDAGDGDYAVYEGALGDYASHAPLTCTTGGALSETVAPGAGNRYYLVVPANGAREGSYGSRASGLPRAPSTAACLPQTHAGCE
jgi:arylsulfatase A-like enzyme